MNVQVNFWLTQDARDEAMALARSQDLTFAQWLRRAVAEKVERERPKVSDS